MTEIEFRDSLAKNAIIVVDDCEDRMTQISASLYTLGAHDVIRLTEPLRVFDILEERCVGLILSNLEMPVFSGVALLQRLQHDPAFREIPFIITTPAASEEDLFLAFEFNAEYVLTFPYSLYELKDILQRSFRKPLNPSMVDIVAYTRTSIKNDAHTEAITHLQRCLDSGNCEQDDDCRLYELMGDCHFALVDYRQAEVYYNKAFVKKNDAAPVLEKLIRTYTLAGKSDEAKKAIKQLGILQRNQS